MIIARTHDALTRALLEFAQAGRPVALVPTMGALHAGHLSLIATARAAVGAGAVAASIFVNPLQFGASEDLSRYPRDEAGDLAALSSAGCDLVWLPDVATMYPAGDATTIEVAGPALGWEGDARPGHFRGVATVVAKLFGQIRPVCAVFGEKDFQQLQVIRRVTADLALAVRIIGAPTQREVDGLAMSSRNRFLSPAERTLAPRLYANLRAVQAALREDASSDVAAAAHLAAARDDLSRHGFAVNYLALVAGNDLRATASPSADARLIAAARLGSVRLLDNVAAVAA